MAIKDEYEVARLWAESGFLKQVADQMEGDYRFQFHLAPPAFATRDLVTGQLQKRAYGGWMLPAFRLLAKGRRLRGTVFDVFGRTAERRMESELLADYEGLLDELVGALTPENHEAAVELARLTQRIRGYGHVLEASRTRVKKEEAALLARFRSPPPPQALAAE
jgi:indolepyruvate ferredoxin oxidoreductase